MSSIYSVYIGIKNPEHQEKIKLLLKQNDIEMETEDIFSSDFAIVDEPLKFAFPHLLYTETLENKDMKNFVKNEMIDFVLHNYNEEILKLKIQNAVYFVMARGSRGALKQKIINEIEKVKRTGGSFTVAMASIIDFNKFENSMSSVAMDELSKEVLKMLKLSMRKSDEVMKISRKEYGMILSFTELNNAEIACERVKRRVKKIGQNIDISVAIGIVEVVNPNEDISKILERLKKALYISESNNGEISIM